MLIILIFISWKVTQKKKNASTFLTYSLKIFSLYELLLNTIATIPLFNVFFATFECNSSDPIHDGTSCYQGIYFMHLTAGIIGLILILFFIFMSTLLYVEINPNPAIPFAAPQSRLGLIKLMLKIALPLYILMDYNVKF